MIAQEALLHWLTEQLYLRMVQDEEVSISVCLAVLTSLAVLSLRPFWFAFFSEP